MELRIALSPELGLDAAQFSAAWNATPECLQVARAEIVQVTGTEFGPPVLAVALGILGNLALGVAGNALYDLVKRALARGGVRRATKIVQLDQPDGTRVLLASLDEEWGACC